MDKAILISIKPEHLVNILTGKKTLELRKSIPKDYKGWVYIYCTKNPSCLIKVRNKYTIEKGERLEYDLNGRVPARFWLDEYTILTSDDYMFLHDGDKLLKDLRLTWSEVSSYAGTGTLPNLYAWSIRKLEIFDKPMKIKDFKKVNPDIENVGAFGWAFPEYEKYIPITRPPQSYQYVWVEKDGDKND